ncbi:hypothetical protein D3C73_531160 [compost metagenome]
METLLAVLVQLVENPVRLLPRKFVGFGDDGTEGNPDARAICPAGLCRFRIDPFDLLFCFGKRFAPKAEDIAEGAADAISRVGRTAQRDRDQPVGRAHGTAKLLELVIFPVEIEGFLRCPGEAQDADILFLPLVALFLVEEVTLARLLLIAAAGDEVDDDATTTQLIERGERLGRNCRVDGVGSECHDDLDVLRMRKHRRTKRERIE